MVKRKGYIIEKVADMDNLRNAAREAQRNKNPRNDSIVAFNANPEPKLQALREMILTLNFPETQYRHKELQNDYGKVRSLCYEDYYPWNVLQYAIMRVIGRDVFSGIVYDSFSCVPGKGTHWGVKRLKMFLRRYPEFKWRVQCDGRKYYFSLPHYIILQRFSRKYKDKKFLKLLEVAVLKFESGPEYMNIFEDEIEKRDKRSKHRRVHEPSPELACV